MKKVLLHNKIDSRLMELLNFSDQFSVFLSTEKSLFMKVIYGDYDFLIVSFDCVSCYESEALKNIKKYKPTTHIILLTNEAYNIDFEATVFTRTYHLLGIVSFITQVEDKNGYLYCPIDKIRISLMDVEVFRDDRYVPLSMKEYKLLCYFLTNRNQVITRSRLLKEIWKDNDDKELRKIDLHVKNLRRKLKLTALETVKNRGYVWRSDGFLLL